MTGPTIVHSKFWRPSARVRRAYVAPYVLVNLAGLGLIRPLEGRSHMKSLRLCTFCLAIAAFTASAQDLDRGIELYRKNDFAAAVSALRQVVDAGDANARANRYLGLALLEQAKAAEAEPFILKANELDPSGESKMALTRLYIEQKGIR